MMHVTVALENRFRKSANGNVYSTTVCDYKFWQRYLEVFNSVSVFARVLNKAETELALNVSNGPNVSFIELPTFIGPWQFLTEYKRIRAFAKNAVKGGEAFILRIPGTIGTVLWQELMRKDLPYGVEVVGDPWDSLGPGSVRSIVRPFLRIKARMDMAKQCRFASAASYVTKYSLQRRYEPGCWSTYYSSVELPQSAFADEAIHQKRLRRIFNKNDGIKPWYLCHVGMMEHMYKGQDVLIDAVAKCIGNGIKLELTMVGDGRLKSKLQTMVKRLKIGEYVKFIGKLPPGDAIYQVLDSADLYVLPSRQEGLPRSVIEAMARGLPCIASNVGGIPELLSVEDLVKSRDANGLAQKIAETISNPTRLREMSFRNIREAEKYRSSELIKRRVEFYKRVADGTEEHTIAKRGR